jgi:hypothetical protein
MKKLYTLLITVILTSSAMAQAPSNISYQAVVRDAANTLVKNQAVGMKISILQNTASGIVVYQETQTPTTNVNGLLSIQIGSGTVVSGLFDTLHWSNGPYFIKTEIDPQGGTAYSITGTSQLLSVPYALHSNTTDSLVGGVKITSLDTTKWNNPTDSAKIASYGFQQKKHIAVTVPLASALTGTEIVIGDMKFRYNANVAGGYLEHMSNNGKSQAFQIYCEHKNINNTLGGTPVINHYTLGYQAISSWLASMTLWDGVGYNDRVALNFYQTQHYEFVNRGTGAHYKVFLTITGGSQVHIRAEYFD